MRGWSSNDFILFIWEKERMLKYPYVALNTIALLICFHATVCQLYPSRKSHSSNNNKQNNNINNNNRNKPYIYLLYVQYSTFNMLCIIQII